MFRFFFTVPGCDILVSLSRFIFLFYFNERFLMACFLIFLDGLVLWILKHIGIWWEDFFIIIYFTIQNASIYFYFFLDGQAFEHMKF